jgi:hypothetical protein
LPLVAIASALIDAPAAAIIVADDGVDPSVNAIG